MGYMKIQQGLLLRIARRYKDHKLTRLQDNEFF